MEHSRRLWGSIFLWPRSLLRHGRLRHRDPAGALRHQRMDWLCRRHCGWCRAWCRARRAHLSFRPARLLLCVGHSRVRGSAAHHRKRCPDHGRRRGHIDQARPGHPESPVSKPRRVLLDHPCAGRSFSCDSATDRTLTVRNMADRGARERRCGKGAGRQCKRRQAGGDGYIGRHYRRRRMLLRAIFSFRGFRNCLWHLDLDPGATDANHRRRRHRVRSAARCSGCEVVGRGRKASDR